MNTFKIRNLATAETLEFDSEYLEEAIDMASRHYFGETPADKMGDKDGRYTLLRPSKPNEGNVIGRVVVM